MIIKTLLKSYFKNPSTVFFLFNLLLFVVFVQLFMAIPYDIISWRKVPDSFDYLILSKKELGYDFFFPVKKDFLSPRGFTIPLFYKFVQSDIIKIITLQRIIYIVSVAVFAFCTHFLFKKRILKYCWSITCYIVLSAWASSGWNELILSESIGQSLLLFWLATFIFYENTKSTPILILNYLTLILLFFSRDNVPYLILLIYLFHFSIKFILKQNYKPALISLVFVALLFTAHNKSVLDGHRHRLPLINTMVTRIVSNEKYLAWFKKEGMPMTTELKNNFVNVNPDDLSRAKVYRLYEDSTYTPFFNWLLLNGKPAYIKFMITHPSYTFLLHENGDAISKKIFPDAGEYCGPMKGFPAVFPGKLFFFPPESLFILLLIVLLILLRSRIYFFNFIQLIIAIMAMLLINYNSDSFEVGRHMYLNLFIRELSGFFMVLFILDNLKDLPFAKGLSRQKNNEGAGT